MDAVDLCCGDLGSGDGPGWAEAFVFFFLCTVTFCSERLFVFVVTSYGIFCKNIFLTFTFNLPGVGILTFVFHVM